MSFEYIRSKAWESLYRGMRSSNRITQDAAIREYVSAHASDITPAQFISHSLVEPYRHPTSGETIWIYDLASLKSASVQDFINRCRWMSLSEVCSTSVNQCIKISEAEWDTPIHFVFNVPIVAVWLVS